MIIVHHLLMSRSSRILWLLEELGLPYEVKRYPRDPATQLAPPELKAVHPLGKSPVIERDGKVYAESGAILEYFAETEGGGKLSVAPGDPARADYLFWLHFAEGSAMLPLLLKIYLDRAGASESPIMKFRVEPEIDNHLSFCDRAMEGKDYFAANRFTVADIQMSFVLDALGLRGGLDRYPNLARVRDVYGARPARQRALAQG
ncbi:MAG: glutathione S-transferase family protein [Hyphomonadaceae bacterium]|nr:glutathione S-transferase family protein [Hyphomonadaceae bacterium]